MSKYGRGKKSDGDPDAWRFPLFGSRSKNKSPAPPYAQSVASPDPYTQAKMNAGIIPPASQTVSSRQPPGSGRGLPSGPSMKNGFSGMNPPTESPANYGNEQKFGAPSGGYGTGRGYRDDKYANPGGYGRAELGSDAYSDGVAGSRYGPGGYGGLGRSNNVETTSIDINREQLFGGALQGVQQREANGYEEPPPYGTNLAQDAAEDKSYGAYGDRQLTAEEEEEEEIAEIKRKVKQLKEEDVAATRNALRLAAQAEETGRDTLARLGAQGERLHNTNRNLDLADNHQVVAEDKAKELKVANRSMFRMHVDNPFTKGGRERRDQEILDRHRKEREQRTATQQAAFKDYQRLNRDFRDIEAAGAGGPQNKASLAERAKYQFEADSEDDEKEKEIEENIDLIGEAASRLGRLAIAQRKEVERQNALVDELIKKVGVAAQFSKRIICADTCLYRATKWTIEWS